MKNPAIPIALAAIIIGGATAAYEMTLDSRANSALEQDYSGQISALRTSVNEPSESNMRLICDIL